MRTLNSINQNVEDAYVKREALLKMPISVLNFLPLNTELKLVDDIKSRGLEIFELSEKKER